MIRTWYDLSRKQQRQVLHLARKGRVHPDRQVAKVAHEWAAETRDSNAATIIVSALGLIVGFFTGADAGVVDALLDQRKAKRILRLQVSGRKTP